VVRFFYFLPKECAVRLKLAIFILFALACLAACQRRSTPTIPPATIEPSIAGLDAPEIDLLTTDTIRERMSLFLKSNPYTEYAAGNQLLLYLVSSGEFDQAEITLVRGETYQADVLYAYAMMSSQRVLVVPVVIGLRLPDSRYAYFSEKYSSETEESITTTDTHREIALADALARLPRGRIFRLLAYGVATRQGLNWKKCPSVSLYPPEICPVGELIEQLYPNQTKSFVLRLANEFSPNWLLIGWVFQEFSPDELVPGVSMDITLPDPPQP
jgi:hypothetical protein